MKRLLLILLLPILFSCKSNNYNTEIFDDVAENYVKLVLEIGSYDPAFVDAYYVPTEWQPEALSSDTIKFPSEMLLIKVNGLLTRLNKIEVKKLNEIEKLRYNYLQKQIEAVKGRICMLGGKHFSFDEETKTLYDVVTPDYSVEHFELLINELDSLIPGEGSLTDRLADFKKGFIIPKEKLDTVFMTAIAEARKRTLKFIELPENENFTLEFVSDKPWGGYNWYKGNNFSLIQINTDLPIYIDRAIDLASHEGYPGHHVYNCLLETHIVKERGWVEFSVYPLFSPQSLIAEGTANYGIEMAFPDEEKIKFEKEVLFPLAGLNPENADKYYKVLELVSKISYVRNAAAEKYLNGDKTKEETIEWLVKYALRDRKSAEQSIKFIEAYRSYIINYNVGLDMVRGYMEKDKMISEKEKWERFKYLISTPQIPSNLK